MKTIKTYLSNQKDLALMMWSNELEKEDCNLALVKHWLDRVVTIDQLINELNSTK